jgi:hypothetical protein
VSCADGVVVLEAGCRTARGVVSRGVVVDETGDPLRAGAEWQAAVPVMRIPTTRTSAKRRDLGRRASHPDRYSRGVTVEWMLDLAGSEPVRSIIAVLWSLLFLTLAFAVIVGVPVAIGVSEQRRRRR